MHRRVGISYCILFTVLFAKSHSAGFPEPKTPAASRPMVQRQMLDDPAVETLVVDINGDGFKDFLMLDQGRLWLRDDTGFPLWNKRNAELDALHVDEILTVCNLDAEGYAEILTRTGGDLLVIDGKSMAILGRIPQATVYGLTDLNKDGVAEIYVARQKSADKKYPPLEVYSLVKGNWYKLWSSPGCLPEMQRGHDAYRIGPPTEEIHIFDLDEDGNPEALARTEGDKGWIGLGFDEKGQFGQKWEWTEIQDGISRMKFLDWTDGNHDHYKDIITYDIDRRMIDNLDIVSDGASIGLFPVHHIDQPASSAAGLKKTYIKPGEWPLANRDIRLTNRSPLPLTMHDAPQEAWSYDMGGAPGGMTVAELDEKPGADLLVAARGRLSAYDSKGNPLWKREGLGSVQVRGLYDFNGDGKNEILIYYRQILSQPIYLILDPASGKTLWEFKTYTYTSNGPLMQIGKFIPEEKGLQMFVWGLYGRADLIFFDFSKGFEAAAKPVWEQNVENMIFPTMDIYDYNSDGRFDLVIVEHSRVRIWDIATGKVEHDFEWGKYRSYGGMLPMKIKDGPYYSLLVTSDNSMHNVEMIDINDTSVSLAWKIPGRIGLRLKDTSEVIKLTRDFDRIGDVDGDGKLDVVYLKLNETGDKKWHYYVRDALTGKLKKDTTLKEPSFDEAGAVKNPPGYKPPNRPQIVQPAPPPPARVQVVDAAKGEVQLIDASGVTATLELPDSILGDSTRLNPDYHMRAADLNGDGKMELIMPHGPTTTTILSMTGQPGQPPIQLKEESAKILLVFDYDQDGKNERLIQAPDPGGSKISLIGADDKVIWSMIIPGEQTVVSSTYGNFNNDGYLDVALYFSSAAFRPLNSAFSINGEYVYLGAWSGKDGRMLWHGSYVLNERPYGYASLPVVFDVNGDGIDDLLSPAADIFTVNSGDTGKFIYQPVFYKNIWNYSGGVPFADDFDGDGKVEIFTQGGGMCNMGATRLPDQPLWYQAFTQPKNYGSFTDQWVRGCADVDGDGKMEIGLGIRTGEFRCYSAADGHLKWSFPTNSTTTDICSADVDGDSKYEFIFGSEDGYLYAVGGGDGEKNPVKWKVDLKAPVGAPIVADVDGDGKGEILALTGDGKLHCFHGK